jgi:hypothetical protein
MADTPFGLSFGNPRQYMGQSPLAEAGKALKTGAILWGLQQSGAIGALDKLGVKPNQTGGFSYNNPTGPAVPPAGGPAQPVMPNTAAPAPVDPNAVAPATPAPLSTTPPANIGADVLDGKFHGAEISSVDPQAQRDFNPFVPQTGYTQKLASGNEYQQVPGYGKIQKAFQAFAGGMG